MTFPPLHVITDDAVLAADTFLADARAMLQAGGPHLALHVRGPRTAGAALHAITTALLPSAHHSGARIIVNDRIDVARAAGADGVQLGGRSLAVHDARTVWPDAWIGTSIHSVGEAERMAGAGTDFVILGTIYPTPSHAGRPGSGPDVLGVAAAVAHVPVVAIGGIDAARVAEVRRAGASGAAVLRAVWAAPDGARAVAALLDAWERQ